MKTEPIEIESRDYWVKVVEMLEQNWALIDGGESGAKVWFVDDASGVFDSIDFASVGEAGAELSKNGFKRFADGEAQELLSPPPSPFHQRTHPNGAIYSSGRYWR